MANLTITQLQSISDMVDATIPDGKFGMFLIHEGSDLQFFTNMPPEGVKHALALLVQQWFTDGGESVLMEKKRVK